MSLFNDVNRPVESHKVETTVTESHRLCLCYMEVDSMNAFFSTFETHLNRFSQSSEFNDTRSFSAEDNKLSRNVFKK